MGDGPAGSTAALCLARQGVQVILIGRPGGTQSRVGESLPPAARPLLQVLGLWGQLRGSGHLSSAGTRSAWGSRDLVDTDFIFNPNGQGWHLDRQAFDAMLAGAAEEAGAQRLFSARLMRCGPSSWGATLCIQQVDDEVTIRVRTVLDCSGRVAVVARGQGVRRVHHDKLVAIAAMQARETGPDCDATTTIEAVPDGWWYTSPLPHGRRVVVYLTDRDLLSARAAHDPGDWLRRLSETDHIRRIVRPSEMNAPLTILSAGSSRLSQNAGDGWFAAGDAAISFDPLSGQGLITAMRGGQRAAQAILETMSGNKSAQSTYAEALEELARDYHIKKSRYYSAETRWPDSPFWQRRLEPRRLHAASVG